MIKAGIRVFVAPPDDTSETGYRLPTGWQNTRCDPAVVDDWQPGWALCAVGGPVADFLDVDPRNGGDASATELQAQGVWPRSYGTASTPSGGTHEVIAALGVRKGTPAPGIDLQAGDSFVFIAPTERVSKVDGVRRPYRWLTEPDTEALCADGPADQSGRSLGALLSRNGSSAPPQPSDVFGQPVQPPKTPEKANELADRLIEDFEALILEGNNRTSALNNLALICGHGVPEFWEEDAVRQRLLQAARDNGYTRVHGNRAALTQINSGLRDGMADPWVRASGPFGGPGAGDEESSEVDSWSPVDVTDVLNGHRVAVLPELGVRTDGVRLLYRGKEHAVAGEPESGKTWFVLKIVLDVLLAGGRVVYVDFEDDSATVVGRLLELGNAATGVLFDPKGDRSFAERLTPDGDQFRYVRPEGPPRDSSLAQLLHFRSGVADLLVFDGWTEGASLLKLDVMKGQDDIAKWRQALVRPALSLGTATLTTDHVVKDKDSRGRYSIGAQHKLAGLTGVMFQLEVVETWGRGFRGRSRLLVTKDRNGGLRPHGKPYRPNVTYIGDLVSDATSGELTSLQVFPPPAQPADGQSGTEAPEPTDEFVEDDQRVLTVVRELVDATGQPATRRAVEAKAGIRKAHVGDALERLLITGQLIEQRGPHGARAFMLTVPEDQI